MEVLEIGCGGGYPITRELVNAGLSVRSIDSSESLLQEFKIRFPEVECRCESLQDTTFFDRKFGAVVAVGVVFLLSSEEQLEFFQQVAAAFDVQGYFLFTAPLETGRWLDSITGMECISLGAERYRFDLKSLGFKEIVSFSDSGKNHYYSCRSPG